MTTRRALARMLAPALVGAGLVLGSGVPAHACSCALQTVRAAAQGADAVFVGTVGPLVDDLEYTNHVEVHRVYQGSVPAEVTINTGQEDSPGVSSSCDLTLTPGREMVFFAAGSGDAYSVGPCDFPSQPSAHVVERLAAITGGAPVAPEPTAPPDSAADEGGPPQSADVASDDVAGTPGSNSLGIGLLLGLGLMGAGAVALIAARLRS